MLNKVQLIGRLGADPEIKYMQNGGQVTHVRLATSRRWKDKQTGERKEETEWHRVVFFTRLAEIAGEYLKKGSQVYIEGRIRTTKWQGQDGQDKYTTEIVAEEMHMLDSKSEKISSHHPGANNPEMSNKSNDRKNPVRTYADFDDSEIPF